MNTNLTYCNDRTECLNSMFHFKTRFWSVQSTEIRLNFGFLQGSDCPETCTTSVLGDIEDLWIWERLVSDFFWIPIQKKSDIVILCRALWLRYDIILKWVGIRRICAWRVKSFNLGWNWHMTIFNKNVLYASINCGLYCVSYCNNRVSKSNIKYSTHFVVISVARVILSSTWLTISH